MPKISVIVPVYRAELYLRDCIDSILFQTFSDFELILVDDGSPDNCGAICAEYAAWDGRVQLLRQENQGQAAARNHGLARAQGDWICFVDSDDQIHPQTLQALYSAAEKTGVPVSMCRMMECTQPPGDFFSPWDGEFEVLTMDEQTLLRLHDADAYPSWVACAKLIRRSLIENHPFCEGRVYEDNEAVCHWVCEAGRVARLPAALYFYRSNPNSTTKSQFTLKRLDYLWALEQIIRFYTQLGYLQLRERFVERYVEAAASCYHGAYHTLGRPDVARNVERSVRKFLRRQKLRLTKAQFELLLDTMHPRLVRLYWPVEGVVRTLREQGAAAVLRKAARQMGKGDSQ